MNWKPVALLLVSTFAFPYELREMSFDERVEHASVVMLGTVERNQPRSPFPQWAEVKVESVLKGSAPAQVRVEGRGMIAESSVRMTAGRRYLFLLAKRDDLYVPVNGHFGVIPVDGKPHHPPLHPE